MPRRASRPDDPTSEWTRAERAVFRKLSSPARIQAYLDELTYRAEDDAVCPRKVLVERRAHCFDGALFAAAALRHLGHPPMLVDLRAQNDDDHVLAVFRRDGHWGAVAKSNFSGLRYREPIYRSVRELAMSYFEDYFNLTGQKTLRECSRPLSLKQYDRHRWMFDDACLPDISDRLDTIVHHDLVTPRMVRGLAKADARAMAAGTVGLLTEGAYRPKGSR